MVFLINANMKILNFLIPVLLITSGASAADSTAAAHYPDLKILPVLWQQTAAEYRALCYQAFNLAKLRVDAIPEKELRKHNNAIITDLDETILDNSYLAARLIKEGKEENMTEWKKWTAQSAATAVPGAVEFLQYANSKGISIYYVSNRDTGEIKTTLINLRKLQLPDADTAHTLFLTSTSSKEERRQLIMSKCNVVMLLGDNLNDFMQVFERKPIEQRKADADKEEAEWGNKFIVLPNAAYGEWENALYEYKHRLSPDEKQRILLDELKEY
jgi:5'-nucleotidase (lipoprotein e(P4) family)